MLTDVQTPFLGTLLVPLTLSSPGGAPERELLSLGDVSEGAAIPQLLAASVCAPVGLQLMLWEVYILYYTILHIV